MLFQVDGKYIPDNRGDISTRLMEHIRDNPAKDVYEDEFFSIRLSEGNGPSDVQASGANRKNEWHYCETLSGDVGSTLEFCWLKTMAFTPIRVPKSMI